MYPKLFGLEWINMYGLLLGLGLIAALAILWYLCKRFKVPEKAYNFYSTLAIIAIAMGLFGAWAFQQIYGAVQAAAEGKTYTVNSGLTFMGGLVFGVVTFVAGTIIFAKPSVRNEFWRVAGFAAPAIAAAQAFGRLGCFCAGCCYGVHDESLGLIFPYGGSRGKVLPTNLYESLFCAALCAVLLLLILKFKKEKFTLLIYGLAYAVWRFTVEFIRGDNRYQITGTLTPSQWQSVILFIAAAALAVYILVSKKTPLFKPLKTKTVTETVAAAALPRDDFYKADSGVQTAETNAGTVETAQESTEAEAAQETKAPATENTEKQKIVTVTKTVVVNDDSLFDKLVKKIKEKKD